MTESETGRVQSNRSAAAAALESMVDPVVAVDTTNRLTAMNAAARKAFSITEPFEGKPAAAVLGAHWPPLESAIETTTVGTVRSVELADDRFDARVHRGDNGATITFDEAASPAEDRHVKERAINEAPVGITISDPDREDNPLVYVNEAYERLTGYAAENVLGTNCRFLQGEDSDPEAIAAMREAIADERPVTVEIKNYRKNGTPFWNEVTVAPVRDDSGEVTHYVGFQNETTARKRAELEAKQRAEDLHDERAELEWVLERVEGLVQDVTADVAGAASRSDLEASVCERIAAEGVYDGAWIGERDPATNAIKVRASADTQPPELRADDDHPAAVAIREQRVAADFKETEGWAAFPLSYNDVDYGVLVVCASDEKAVDEREQVVLSALARAVASGINARETSRILATDAVVAVELDLVDEGFAPAQLSKRTGGHLEYRRSVHRTDDETASLFSVTGTTVEALTEAADDLSGVTLHPIVEHESGSLIELRTEEPGVVEWLSDRGAVTQSISAEDGHARLTLEMPESANVRSVVEAVEERYPGTDVVSFRHRERTEETRQEFAARIDEELTDRQLAALQRAYLGGYFEWPRPTTGEELASSMDVSRPTFHEHLRAAEGKLCQAFFERE